MVSSPVDDRLTAIEARLTRIEQRLSTSDNLFTDDFAHPSPTSSLSGRLSQTQGPQVTQRVSSPGPSATLSSTASSLDPEAFGKSGNWLGLIAVLCFVLAAGFIIKLSIDSGWLTPVRQIGLASLLGFGLIGTGLTLVKSDRTYASFLPSAGAIILYTSVFAAHRYYVLIPFGTALALTMIVSGLCIWLYTRIDHDVYPLVASTGAYLAPLLLGLHTEDAFTLYYFAVCSFAFAAMSIWLRSRTLILVSAYLAIIATGFIGFDLHNDPLVVIFLGLHFVVFSTGTYLYAYHTGSVLTEFESSCYLPVLLIFYAMEYYFMDRINSSLAPWISLGFTALLFGLYLVARRNISRDLGSQSVILAFTTLVCFHSLYLEILPVTIRPALLVFILLGAAFTPPEILRALHSRILVAPGVALLAIVGIEYLSITQHLIDLGGYSPEWLNIGFAALVSLWVFCIRTETHYLDREVGFPLVLAAAHFLAIMSFYRLTASYGALAVSVSWLSYGILVVGISFSRKDEIIAKSAAFVLAFAAGKALIFDAASAPTGVRIVCLILTGAVLFGCGFYIRKASGWASDRVSQPRTVR